MAPSYTLLFAGSSHVAFPTTTTDTNSNSNIIQGRSGTSSIMRNSQHSTQTVAKFPSENCGTDFFVTSVLKLSRFTISGIDGCVQSYFTSKKELDLFCQDEADCDQKDDPLSATGESSTTKLCEELGFINDEEEKEDGEDDREYEEGMCFQKYYSKQVK